MPICRAITVKNTKCRMKAKYPSSKPNFCWHHKTIKTIKTTTIKTNNPIPTKKIKLDKTSRELKVEKTKTKTSKELKIVCIGDLHNRYPDPKKFGVFDVYLCPGDFVDMHSSVPIKTQLSNFNNWLSKLKCGYRIVTLGNHEELNKNTSNSDIGFYKSILTNAKVVDVGKVLIPFGNSNAKLQICISSFANNIKATPRVPLLLGCGILLTHMPPLNIMDCPKSGSRYKGLKYLKTITQNKMNCHVFGHCHKKIPPAFFGGSNTLYVNASSPHGFTIREDGHMKINF
jgi:Icc-related predicted phosphoesterase